MPRISIYTWALRRMIITEIIIPTTTPIEKTEAEHICKLYKNQSF